MAGGAHLQLGGRARTAQPRRPSAGGGASYRLQATSYNLKLTSHKVQITRLNPGALQQVEEQVTGYKLQVTT